MSRTFADLGVSKPVVAALAERNIVDAFPIQEAVIEAALAGRDLCGKAPTGSGKTLAFGVPAVDLAEQGSPWRPKVLILSPTRELASQIKDELEQLAKARSRTIVTVFGGTNIERDIKRLERGVDILVACPGRLEDLISRRCCELNDIQIAVVDEADRMADMGFLPAVKRILDQTPKGRHMLLFSATLDGDVDALVKRYQHDPEVYEVEEQADQIGDVEHSWYLVPSDARIDSAVSVLQGYYSSIVFCRTRRGCDRVAKSLAKRGLPAVAIHGDRSQSQRERALRDFADGTAQVLVATDVAARGIHVDNVELVMHYDPAGSDKDYIHRSGRTGRAGSTGRVISMVVDNKAKTARELQRDLGVEQGFDPLPAGGFTAPERPSPDPARNKAKTQDSPSSPRSDRGSKRDGRNRDRDRNDRDRDRDRNDRDRSRDRGRDNRGRDSRGRDGRSRDSRDRDGRSRDNRGRDSRSRDSGERDNRSRGRDGGDRDNRSRGRDGGDRDNRSRGRDGGGRDNRGRDDRGRDDRSRDSRRPDSRSGGRYRDDGETRRDNRGRDSRGRDSRDRDNRGRDSRGRDNRGRDDRSRGRDDRGDNPRRPRRKKNDWYPPGWDEDRSEGDNRWGRNRESDEQRPGGSGTTKRRNRNEKGRHSDRDKSRSKGKRRRPNE